MGRIERLDPVVSSQIAAGEVVERPASVVKELVENSLDAGAARIIVEFEDAGLTLIRVSDNGSGMSSRDAVLSVERFATSKLSSIEDLSNIASLGFRGEALPSIASCSRLVLETKAEDEDSGTEVLVEGGVLVKTSEKGLPVGTTVTVRELFFNTPARLKFVRSRSSERQAIVDTVMRLALAWPHISFTLKTGGKTILATSGQGLRNALMDIFGPEAASSFSPVSWNEGHLSVSGFTGNPSNYRRQRDRQIFSVNGRPVKDPVLSRALDYAYTGLLPHRTYPQAVLDVRLPPDQVDVNVHPTKSQVKFKDEQALRRGIRRAVAAALSERALSAGSREDDEPSRMRAGGSYAAPPRYSFPGRTRDSLPPARAPLSGFRSLVPTPGVLDLWKPSRSDTGDTLPGHTWEYLGSIADTYLVASAGSSLIIVDKHALMESLVYRAMRQGESGSQDLLMAEIIRLDPVEASVFEDYKDALLETGFNARLVGDRTVMVSSVPLVLGKALPPESLRDVLARLASGGKSSVSPERMLDVARIATAACHASVRARESLSREGAAALIQALETQPEASTCPHGRPVARELTLKEIGEYFGRSSHGGGGPI
ncbi:MAG: DNA mismatch repair endonuclease MutL [Bacillota bacterium]